MRELDPLTAPLSGLQLIEASAGTGKTFAITTLAVRGVLAGFDIGRILVVTFTNAATSELRRRLRERLSVAFETYGAPDHPEADDDLRELVRRRIGEGQGDADRRRLRAALDGFDEAAIFTIHGFCQRALREFAFESGAAFDAELIGDPRPRSPTRCATCGRPVSSTRPGTWSQTARSGVDLAALAHTPGAFAPSRSARAPVARRRGRDVRWARGLVRDGAGGIDR